MARTERGATLRRYRDAGYAILGTTWQPTLDAVVGGPDGLAPIVATMNGALEVAIDVPEPLRVAHLIAGGVTDGQSRGRA